MGTEFSLATSQAMREMKQEAIRLGLAQSHLPSTGSYSLDLNLNKSPEKTMILILGPTGSGKTIVAHAIKSCFKNCILSDGPKDQKEDFRRLFVEDLLTKKSSDFYSASIRNKMIRKLKKNGTIQDQEIEMNVNGKHIWVKANLRINCGGTCVECFLTDVTELVEMRERELLKMKCLSDKIDVKMAALAS